MTGDWEHLAHGADIGVRGRGATLAEAFANAAVALTAVITEPQCVQPQTAVTLHCEAPDVELLLVDWLNALLYEMATRGMLFSRFEVDITDSRLDATAYGESVSLARHRPAVEVKGATMTGLVVRKLADNAYIAECVVDV